jgi:hypothetical protein
VDENASDSILRNDEPDSIKTDVRDLQELKQEEPIISTVRGTTIDGRDERPQALDRIARTKSCAPIQTITRRRWTGQLIEIPQQSLPRRAGQM